MPLPTDPHVITSPTENSTVASQFSAYGTCSAIGDGCTISAELQCADWSNPVGSSSLSTDTTNLTWEALFMQVPSGTSVELVVTCTTPGDPRGTKEYRVKGLTTGSTLVAVTKPPNGGQFADWGDHIMAGSYPSGYTVTTFVTQSGTQLPAPVTDGIPDSPPSKQAGYQKKLYKLVNENVCCGSNLVAHLEATDENNKKYYASSGLFTVNKTG